MSASSKFQIGPSDLEAIAASLLLIPLSDGSEAAQVLVSSIRSKLRKGGSLNPFESQLCGKAVVMACDFLQGHTSVPVPPEIAGAISPFRFQLLRLYPVFQRDRDTAYETLQHPELF